MGHINNTDREYHLLQQRLDRMITGAPYSPVFINILKIIFSKEEANIARKLPTIFTSVKELSKQIEIPFDELNDKLSEMARKGLIIDIYKNENRYISLAPVIIGFFEFTFMRVRDDISMKELAILFDEYMKKGDTFAKGVFNNDTQIGRSLVYEEAVDKTNLTEFLDYEKASHLIQSANVIGVSLCACRHKASHLGKACDAPMENCLNLNFAAESFIRSQFAKQISTNEAMNILDQAKENGLAQTADNVKQHGTYICNCCGCCCGMMNAIKNFNIRNAIVSSNWIMKVENDFCKGCGKCVKACPIHAISLIPKDSLSNQSNSNINNQASSPESKDKRKAKNKNIATVDESLCLGCGVCYSSCKNGGIILKPRLQRVITPENTVDRVVTMAIERGKLADLILDDPTSISYQAVKKIVSALENLSAFKAIIAIKPLKSVFLQEVVKNIRRSSGEAIDSLL